jgi:hypothetical protein
MLPLAPVAILNGQALEAGPNKVEGIVCPPKGEPLTGLAEIAVLHQPSLKKLLQRVPPVLFPVGVAPDTWDLESWRCGFGVQGQEWVLPGHPPPPPPDEPSEATTILGGRRLKSLRLESRERFYKAAEKSCVYEGVEENPFAGLQ